MQIQQRLWDGEPLENIIEQYSLEANYHDSLPLLILNYGIHTPKNESLGWDCRALTLELGTWNVVARSFRRFFNYGEMQDQNFDWNDFYCEHKEDGSLMVLYYYKGQWRVNTRGSYANMRFNEAYDKTWSEAFFEILDRSKLSRICKACSYVFEYCSPWNQVVRQYKTPELYLLSVFDNVDNFEYSPDVAEDVSKILGRPRPHVVPMRHIGDIQSWLEDCEDPTFEGFVLRDNYDRRIKVKSAKYVALHHLHDNGNLALPKRMLPFVLSDNGEEDELLTYFPHLKDHYLAFKERVAELQQEVVDVWNLSRHIEEQKDFAQFVLSKTKASGILFKARKQERCPLEVMREEEQYVLKLLGA